LPDWSQSCQFCQTDLKNVPRPKPAPGQAARRPLMQTAPWIWPAYYIISGYYVVGGLTDVIRGVILMTKHTDNVIGEQLGFFGYIGIIVGAIQIIIGLGLLLRIEFIRAVVNFFCWISILSGAFGLLGSVLAGGFFTGWGIMGIALNVFNIVSSALMIYLIGETD
jgi:hypothetical protein